METQLLLKLSFITAIVSLIGLFFLSEMIEPKLTNISEITKDKLEDFVKVQGTISKTIETDGLWLIDVQDASGKIRVVVFKDPNNPLEFSETSQIEVTGKVIEYKGTIEIQASEINTK